jgi:hypothetical protein
MHVLSLFSLVYDISRYKLNILLNMCKFYTKNITDILALNHIV